MTSSEYVCETHGYRSWGTKCPACYPTTTKADAGVVPYCYYCSNPEDQCKCISKAIAPEGLPTISTSTFFFVSNRSRNSITMGRASGELMELSEETLEKIWKEYF